MQTPNPRAWLPGHIAWLQASTHAAKSHARHAAPSRVAHLARTAQDAHEAPVVTPPHKPEPPVARPAPRMGSEARYVRRWLQPRLEELCEAVLRSALGGDMEATRLLLRMGGMDGKTEAEKKRKPTKTGPGFAKKALDEFRAR